MAVAAMLLVLTSRGVGTAQTPAPRQLPPRCLDGRPGDRLCLEGRHAAVPAGADPVARRRNGPARVARTVSDGDGRFRFEGVDPGAYVVELLSLEDKVLAVGDLFGVLAGGQATTLVRLSSKAPWFAGFFGNAAAAAIAAASTLGVTAVGSNGSPASAQ